MLTQLSCLDNHTVLKFTFCFEEATYWDIFSYGDETEPIVMNQRKGKDVVSPSHLIENSLSYVTKQLVAVANVCNS